MFNVSKVILNTGLLILLIGCGDQSNAAETNQSTVSDTNICSYVNTNDITKIVATQIEEGKTNDKLHFPNTYLCEWKEKGKVLPEFTFYYYARQYHSLNPYAVSSKTEDIPGLSHKAIIVYSKEGDVVQLISRTSKGALSFVFLHGLKKDSSQFETAVKLLNKTSEKTP